MGVPSFEKAKLLDSKLDIAIPTSELQKSEEELSNIISFIDDEEDREKAEKKRLRKQKKPTALTSRELKFFDLEEKPKEDRFTDKERIKLLKLPDVKTATRETAFSGLPSPIPQSQADTGKLLSTTISQGQRQESFVDDFVSLPEVDYNEFLGIAGGSKRKALANYIIEREKEYVRTTDPKKIKEELQAFLEVQGRGLEGKLRGKDKAIEKFRFSFLNGTFEALSKFLPFSKKLINELDKSTKSIGRIHQIAFQEEALKKVKPASYQFGKFAGDLAGYSFIYSLTAGLSGVGEGVRALKWLPKLLKSKKFGTMISRSARFGITSGATTLLQESSDAINKEKFGIEELTSSDDPKKRTLGRVMLKAIKATGSGAVFGLLDVGGRKINALVGLAYGAINGMLQKGATAGEVATSAVMFGLLNSATATSTAKPTDILKSKSKMISYLVNKLKFTRDNANRLVDNTISSYIKNGANTTGIEASKAIQRKLVVKLKKDANALIRKLSSERKIPVDKARNIVLSDLKRKYNIFFKQVEYIDNGSEKTFQSIMREITDSQANKVNPLKSSEVLKNKFSTLIQNIRKLDSKGRRDSVDKFIRENKLVEFRDDIQEAANKAKGLLTPQKTEFGLEVLRDFDIAQARKNGIKNIASADMRNLKGINSAFGSEPKVDQHVFRPTIGRIKEVIKEKYPDLKLLSQKKGGSDEFVILPLKQMSKEQFTSRLNSFKRDWDVIINDTLNIARSKGILKDKITTGFDIAVSDGLGHERSNSIVKKAKLLDKLLQIWNSKVKIDNPLKENIAEARASLQNTVFDEDTLGRGTIEFINDIRANAVAEFGKSGSGGRNEDAVALFKYLKKNKKVRDYIFDTINTISSKNVDTIFKRFSKQAFHVNNVFKANAAQSKIDEVKELFKTMGVDNNPTDDLFSTFGNVRKENNTFTKRIGNFFSRRLGRLNKIYHTGDLGSIESLAYTVQENTPHQARAMAQQVSRGMFKNFTPAEKAVFTIYTDIVGKVGSKTAQKKAVNIINELYPKIKQADPNWTKKVDMKKIRNYTKAWDNLQKFLANTSEKFKQGNVSMQVNQLGESEINTTYRVIEDVLNKSNITPSKDFSNLLLDIKGKTLTAKQFAEQIKKIKGISKDKNLIDRIKNSLIQIDILKNTHHIKHTVTPKTSTDLIQRAVGKISKQKPFTPSLATENIERRVETIEQLVQELKRKGGKIESLNLDPEIILSDQLSTYMRNMSLFNFQKGLLKSNLVRDPNKLAPAVVKSLQDRGWVKMSIPQKGGFSSGYTEMFDGMMVEPSTRVALSDLHDTMTTLKSTSGISKFYMKVNGLMKMKRFFQFYRVISNDLVQMGLGDPRAYGKILSSAKEFANNDKIYHQLGGAGVYNQALFITEHGKKLGELNKFLDPKIVKNMSALDPSIKRFFKLPATALQKFYDVSGTLAWNGDKILRTAMFKQFKSNGLNTVDAINRTQMFMSHYDRILTSNRRALNAVFFVPTYRIQMLRLSKELALHPVKNRGAIFRTGLAKILTGMALAPAGFSVQQQLVGEKKLIPPAIKKLIPFFGYRFSRDLEDGKKEMLSFSSPLFEMDKILSRPLQQTLLYNLAALPASTIQIMYGKNFIGQDIAKRNDPLAVKVYKNLYFMMKTWFPPLELVDRIVKDEDKKLYRSLINGIGFANIYTLKERGLGNIANDLEGWIQDNNGADFGDEEFTSSAKKIIDFSRKENNATGEGWDNIWKGSDKWKRRR